MNLGEDGEDTMTDELADDNASNSGVSEKNECFHWSLLL